MSATICSYGCLLVAYNMLADHWGISDGRLPDQENDYYVANGGFNNQYLVSMAMSVVYPQVKNDGWLNREDLRLKTRTKDYLSRGIPVCARVDFKPATPQWEQHWVLIVGYDEEKDDWLMNDPWTGKKAVYVSDYYGIPGDDLTQCIYYYLDETEPPPTGEEINLRHYQVGIPTAFRVVKHVDGNGHETNEDVQDMWLDATTAVMRKNNNGEWYRFEDGYRKRLLDTSPGADSQGTQRVYRMTQEGTAGGRVNPDTITAGVHWADTSVHHVQFYAKDNCRELPENSGDVLSNCTARIERNVTFNTYGQNLTFDEVVYIMTNNGEEQMYGVYQGNVVGWIGWVAGWGQSEPVEIHFDRGVMTQEPQRYCSW